jgi:hypothetical protein
VGYDGAIAVNSGGRLVNGSGTPIQLRGINVDGMDSQIMGGWPSNPWGSIAGAGGPPWPTIKTWKANFVRLPVNVGAFLNLNQGVLTGGPTNAAWTGAQVAGDPNLVYRQALLAAIQGARSIGCYIVIDVHWAAPKFTLGGVTNFMGAFGQPMFLDYDTSYPFWTAAAGAGPVDATGKASTGLVAWLQANAVNPVTGNINDIIFELFNEPFLDGQSVNCNTAQNGTGTALSNEQVMLNGGWVSGFSNQYVGTGRGGTGCPNSVCGASGQPGTTTDAYTFNYWWRAAGYQQVLDGIRALGASNVILVNGLTWSSKQSMISQVYPADTLSPPQVGTGFHIYESGVGSGFPGTGDSGSGSASAYQYANANINGTGGIGHPIPLLVTEYGNANNTGSGPSAPMPDPYMANVQAWLDSQPVGGAGGTSWAWGPPASYGSSATSSWISTIFDAPFTFTASISGTTMTVTAGSGISPGCVLTGGAADRTYVSEQLTGTTGGPGTYSVSISQSQSNTTMTGQFLAPQNGQGMTQFNWMSTHS